MSRARPRVVPEYTARTVAAPLGERGTASLLDLDPDLGHTLTPALFEQVRRWLVVPVWSLRRGHWGAALPPGEDMLGLLVLDGVLTRSVSLGRVAYPELLGAGDLLRPWQRNAHASPLAAQVEWQVIEPCHLAVLDQRFSALVCRWPEVVAELVGRAQRRADELDLRMAIAQLPLLELRLLGVLWHIAGRWGVAGPDGVHVPVRLTHAVLAGLVLGRRASTSRALSALTRGGLITRVPEGWVLHGEPPKELHTLSRRNGRIALGR